MVSAARKRRLWRPLLPGLCLVVVAGLFLVQPSRVTFRLWQARRALAEQDAQGALARLEIAERLDPDCSDTQCLMARAYLRLGQLDQARARIARASQLGHPSERMKREELLMRAQSGEIPLTHPDVLAMLMDPGADAPDIYEAVTRGSLQTFQVSSALSVLEAWEGDYPASPQPHFYRGLILSHQGEWPRAITSFRRALVLAPDRYDVRLYLARALREHYEYREAIRHYRLCLSKHDDPEALFGLAMCLEAMGKSEEAREKYKLLLARVPDHSEARLAIGELDLSYGDAQQALDWLEPAARKTPHECNLRLALARALRSTGQPERAREHFEYAARAQAAASRLKHLVRRVAEDPENVEIRYEIGMNLLEYGPPSDAAVWLKSVLLLQPDHQGAREALADCYARLSPPARAVPASPQP